MATKKGKHTILLDTMPSILNFAAIASKKESEGPLANCIDTLNEDTTFGEKTWEKAESQMQRMTVSKVLEKAGLAPSDIDCIFAGDLLNQCISSTFGLREMGIPYFGIYGACSTMSEGIALGSLLIDGGGVKKTIAATSSHFCTAERQYRFPLEYGGQRTPTSQWTVTGSGALIMGESVSPPYIKAVTIGTIEDLGIKDSNNMGAAMAPAAAATIKQFFEDTLTDQNNYDLIVTGDLGSVGSEILCKMMCETGFDIREKHNDCGLMIYNRETQDVHAGGSGCGCSATVLCSYILPEIKAGRFHEVLFIATGALLSPTSVQQGDSIPCIAHLVHISDNNKEGVR